MNMLRPVRYLMEKNRYLKKLVKPIRETKLMTYRRDNMGLREAKGMAPKFKVFYEAHKGEFEKVAQMLQDDFSRKSLQALIDYRLNPRMGALKGITVLPQYFMLDIFGPVENEVFVDGGAYIGDTILDLISKFGNGQDYYKKIYAWEPDDVNRKKLIKSCKDYKNIEVLPLGMWSEKTTLSFQLNGDSGSHFSEEGTVKISVDSIDDLCSDEKITFIKMDIEGSEVQALRGAEHVIRRDKPRLSICIYHRPEDFYEIPFLIREMVPEYKLYIRHHSGSHRETVLYAVCPSDGQ